MKFGLIVVIFILFMLVAFFVYYRYLIRLNLFKDLGYVCKMLKNNISFNKNDIDTILANAYIQLKPTSRYIIKNFSKQNLRLVTASDITLVNDFFDSLGLGDVDYEINNIGYYETSFAEIENQAKDDVKKKGSTYFKIIVGVGLIICIILL